MTISKPLLVGQLAAQVARAPLALVGVEGAPPISQVSTRSFGPLLLGCCDANLTVHLGPLKGGAVPCLRAQWYCS